MTDINDITAAYQRYQEALRATNEFNKLTLFDALTAAKITTVLVTFDGEGDSGQIEDIVAYSDGEARSIPSLPVEIRRASWAEDKLETTQTTLRGAIETLCYDALSEKYDGWENNDGAYGEFTFDVAMRSIELEFNGRFTDVVTTNHTL